MENHLKNSIKDSFKNRTIVPKRDLWSELEQKLDQQQPSPKRKIGYYAVAACLVVLIATGLWFIQPFSSQQIIENNHITKEETIKNTIENPPEQLQKTQSVSDPIVAVQKENIAPKLNDQPLVNKRDKELDAYIDEVLSDVSADKIIAMLNEDVVFENKVDSIYQAMNFQNVSAEELLLIASTELEIDRYIASKVDVNKMLQDVDKETFKERVKQFFDKVSSEYDKLKFALLK